MTDATRTSDSIPRLSVRDLMLSLSFLGRSDGGTTLENLRLRLCLDRGGQRQRPYLWSRARDVAQELRRLRLAEVKALPRDVHTYGDFSGQPIALAPAGNDFFVLLRADRAAAYNRLFEILYEQHPYLRAFVRTLLDNDEILVPVLTSYNNHIGERYHSAETLVEDIARGRFDVDPFLDRLSDRNPRPLEEATRTELRRLVLETAAAAQGAATQEDPPEFAKKFLLNLNETVVPVLLAPLGIAFDYRTLRSLWRFGEELQTWWDTPHHPDRDGSVVFRTADIEVDGDRVTGLHFPNGVEAIGRNFLERLYAAYQTFHSFTRLTYADAWVLRAVFCYENRCQPAVFEYLLETHYTGDRTYSVQLEIERQRPRHVRSLVVGRRPIGTIAVIRTTP